MIFTLVLITNYFKTVIQDIGVRETVRFAVSGNRLVTDDLEQ